ncbi:hypothetical protein LSH36_1099g00006 [Paralvinella palmiformis]|uniref:PAS domain-containing protein n=1 Tax=Paralvinella palmiformis TaxID=53620 RepID=A0AAD9IW93_9ANNE|nr:hypothetical protein LSH36_1099g00006 [Paralvinella palmiformis]
MPVSIGTLSPVFLEVTGGTHPRRSVEGFLLVVNQNGQLIFTTDAFTSILGHSLVDVLGISIYRLIHPEDEDVMRQQFKGHQMEHENKGCSGQRSLYVRMAAKTNKPSIHYENIHIIGHLKVIPPPDPTNLGHPESELCLIGVGRVVSSEAIYEICPLPDSSAKQWITRHEMDGTITFSDQRGAWLTGFMPGESIGMPAYALVHPEDISSIVAVHNLSSMSETNGYSDNMKGTQKNEGIIPEVISECSGNVSVIVGNQKYEILLADGEAHVEPANKMGPGSGYGEPIFDPDVHRDSGKKGIPTVRPVFLGDGEENVIHKSIYDDINAYLGNDPTTVVAGVTCAGANSSRTSSLLDESSHRPGSDSALSNLHAMIENSCHSFGSPQPHPHLNPEINDPQQRNSEACHIDTGCNLSPTVGRKHAQAVHSGNYQQDHSSTSGSCIAQHDGAISDKPARPTAKERRMVQAAFHQSSA